VLKARGINAVMIVGLATDYCVVETGLDAIDAGLSVTVHTGGVRAVDVHPGDGDNALQRLATAGANIL
jgi:nicotinamidase/pyrazinamidase